MYLWISGCNLEGKVPLSFCIYLWCNALIRIWNLIYGRLIVLQNVLISSTISIFKAKADFRILLMAQSDAQCNSDFRSKFEANNLMLVWDLTLLKFLNYCCIGYCYLIILVNKVKCLVPSCKSEFEKSWNLIIYYGNMLPIYL